MAEQKPSDREDREAAEPKGPGGKKKRLALVGLIGGVMFVEGAGIFVATRFLTGSTPAEATGAGLVGGASAGGHGGGTALSAAVEKEVVVAQFRAMNDRTGQNIIYDVKVYGRVAGDKVDLVQKLFEEKKASIEDRMAKVIRAADPQFFKEPGLETLRRQIKHEVDGVLGDDHMMQEILIPSLMWYNADG